MIHLRPFPRPVRRKCDTRALENARQSIHRQLRDELTEEAISQQIVDRHNERVRRNALFRQTGSLD